MTSITHGSIAEYEEREALKEHLAGLIVENKKLCEQIEILKASEQCINRSKDYAFEDLQKAQFALENCRLFAARHRKEDWAVLILGFCAEAGVVGSVTR